jgi:hypothetical protein
MEGGRIHPKERCKAGCGLRAIGEVIRKAKLGRRADKLG